MLKKIMIVLIGVVMLSACGTTSKQETQSKISKVTITENVKRTQTYWFENAKIQEDKQTSVVVPEKKLDRQEVYYRNELIKAKDEQQMYIKSLSRKLRKSEQSVRRTIFLKGLALISQFPKDEDTITRMVWELVSNEEDTSKGKQHITDDEEFEINRVMTLYSHHSGDKYRQCTPTTQGYYYNQSVPNEVLQHVYFNGKQISFKWYDTKFGKGKEYQLKGCYVNENKKEFILFVERSGTRLVLQSSTKKSNNIVNVTRNKNYILTQYVR